MPRTIRALLWIAFGILVGVEHARANFIVNGDFEQGNVGFSTQYTYAPGDIGGAQSYDVVDNPAHSRPHDINPVSYGDHTTGSGLMMAINGAEVPNQVFWSETLSVAPNSDYDFSVWISSWFPTAPATLDIRFNGVSVGTPSAPSTVAVWQQFTTTWNSDGNTTLKIEMIDTNLADIGSDFAVDDISLNGPSPTTSPEPSSLVLFAMGGVGLAGWGWLRRRPVTLGRVDVHLRSAYVTSTYGENARPGFLT